MTCWRWPAIVIGLLSAHVLGCLFFLYLATSNPSFAVEEDYYQKAVRWDEKRAQDRRNAELGWRAVVELEPAGSVDQDAMLLVGLVDAAGAPVEGAQVAVEAFAVARADRISRLVLTSRGGGVYETPVAIRRAGRWEFRLVVDRDGDRFTAVDTRHVFPTVPGGTS